MTQKPNQNQFSSPKKQNSPKKVNPKYTSKDLDKAIESRWNDEDWPIRMVQSVRSRLDSDTNSILESRSKSHPESKSHSENKSILFQFSVLRKDHLAVAAFLLFSASASFFSLYHLTNQVWDEKRGNSTVEWKENPIHDSEIRELDLLLEADPILGNEEEWVGWL
jgi:hypothetical protein